VSAIFDDGDRSVVFVMDGAEMIIGGCEKETASGHEQVGNVTHQLLVIDNVLDVFATDSNIKASVRMVKGLQLSNVENLESSIWIMCDCGSQLRLGLFVRIPRQAGAAITAPRLG
jgi:hypothetical protein